MDVSIFSGKVQGETAFKKKEVLDTHVGLLGIAQDKQGFFKHGGPDQSLLYMHVYPPCLEVRTTSLRSHSRTTQAFTSLHF